MRSKCRMVKIIARPSEPIKEGGILAPPPMGIRTRGRNVPICRPRGVHRPRRLRGILTLGPSLIIATTFKRVLPGRLLSTPGFNYVGMRTSLLPRLHNNTPVRCSVLRKGRGAKVAVVCVTRGLSTNSVLARIRIPVARESAINALRSGLDTTKSGLLSRALPGLLGDRLAPVERGSRRTAFTCGVGERRRGVS